MPRDGLAVVDSAAQAHRPPVDQAAIEAAITALLRAIGEDVDRDGIRDTPARVARMWAEFIDYAPGKTETTFAVENVDQMVIVRGLRLWSLCEHHLVPFAVSMAVAYIPRERVLGLSKIARIGHAVAHRLQLQERLTEEVAAEMQRITGSPDVAVYCEGEHLCMSMRGIRTEGTMVTSVMHGMFKDNGPARAEFLELARTR